MPLVGQVLVYTNAVARCIAPVDAHRPAAQDAANVREATAPVQPCPSV